jgi:F0F1-type ATP synthase assembly protein I
MPLPKKKNKNKNKDGNPLKSYARYSGMAFQMLATIALGAWGGTKLDEHFQTEMPWFTLGLAILSVILAIYMAVKDFL